MEQEANDDEKEVDNDKNLFRLLSELESLSKPSQLIILVMDRLSLSLIATDHEVVTVTLENTSVEIVMKGDGEHVYQLEIGRIQVDNSSPGYPLFPVICSPRCTLRQETGKKHDHGLMNKTVFACVKMRTDVPDVTYCTVVNFLIQELELKIELTHCL